MVLPQAMAWVQYWFRVFSLEFCGKSKKICWDISQVSPAFCMYAPDGANNWSKRCANKNDWRRQNQMQELNVSKLMTWWFSTKWKGNLGSELFEVLCSAVIAVSPDSALWTDFTSSDINFLNQLPKTCTSPFILKYINAITGYRGGQIWNMN